MATPAQAYVNSFFNQGRLSSGSGGLSNAQGLEGGLSTTATAGALGATAVYPVVLNNMSYADDYNNLTKAVGNVGSAGGIYSNYKTALGLADYDSAGSDQFANTFSPGNLFRAGVETASYTNPLTGVLNAVNSITRDEENPEGTIPGVSFVQGKVDAMADAMNNSQLGTAISRGARNIYNKTIAPVVQSKPGKLLTSTAGLPMGLAESGYQTLREGYQALDRGLFGGYLPGGAKDDVESQRFDNPLNPLRTSYKRFKNAINGFSDTDNQSDLPVISSEGEALWNTRNNFQQVELSSLPINLQKKVYDQSITWSDLTPLDQQNWINQNTDSDQSFSSKQDYVSGLSGLAQRAQELGYDMDAKGNITKRETQPIKFNDMVHTLGSYDSGGEKKVMKWVQETRPDKINLDLEYKEVDGHSAYYKKGTNVPFAETREYAEYITSMDDRAFLEYLIHAVDPSQHYVENYDMYDKQNEHTLEGLRYKYLNKIGRFGSEGPYNDRDQMKDALASTKTQKEYEEKMGFNDIRNGKYGSRVWEKEFGRYQGGYNLIYGGAQDLAESGTMGYFYTKDGEKTSISDLRDDNISSDMRNAQINSAMYNFNASQVLQNQLNNIDTSFYQQDYNMSNPVDNYINNIGTGSLDNAYDYNMPNNYDKINF